MTYRPPDRESSSRPFNPLLAIGALIGAIALVAVVIVALSQRGNEPVTGASGDPTPSLSASESPAPSSSASPSASVSPEPSLAAGPPTITWEEPAAFAGAPDEVMVDPGSATWIAVGWGPERGPGAWTSLDARTWEPAEVVDPQPDDMFRGSGLGPTIRLGDSLLSYGTFIGCCDGRGILGWRSADGGRSWR